MNHIPGQIDFEIIKAKEEGKRKGLKLALSLCKLIHRKAVNDEFDLEVDDDDEFTEADILGQQHGIENCISVIKEELHKSNAK